MTANVIIKQVLLRRGNTANTSVYVGPVGEAVVDTDLKTLRVQDGLTPGGTLLATASSVTNVSVGISSINSNVTAANIAIASLQSNAAVQAQSIASLQTSTTSLGNAIVTANTAMKGYVDTQDAALRANITAANLAIANLWANAVSQDYHIGVLYGNAAAQHYNLLNLNSNAFVQAEQIDYLFGNVAQHDLRLIALESEDVYQEGFLQSLLSNSAAQGYEIENLWANAAAQTNALTTITADTTAIWANAAVQENEISGLRANIIAANAAMIAANVNLTNYTNYQIGSRTGEITFSGRTISANVVGGASGIDIAPEARFASFVGFNNSDPQHWVDIGDGLSENVNQNTGSLGIGFNNGLDTLQGHAIVTWDWWDTTLTTGTHNDGTGTHSRLVIINNDNFNKPYVSFDNATGNVVVGNVTADILRSNVGHFSGNTYSSYVIFNNDVRYSNGTPYMSGISARLDAANVAMNTTVNVALSTSFLYTDTKLAALVNGAPAILDTLGEIATSLGNDANLSTTLLNSISSTNSNVSAANISIDNLWSNAAVQGGQIANLLSNAASQGDQLVGLLANSASQETQISGLRSNIIAANAAIITNLAYTNQLNNAMTANITATNAAIVTANVAMKNYVDDNIDIALGNLEILDTTIKTKIGSSGETIIIDAGGEIVLKDFTGIRNPNPGYWLHIGDALDNSGVEHNGRLAVDYSSGLGGTEATGHRGSVVFDYLWWSNTSQGNYNVVGGPSRRFGLLNDGSYPQYSNEEFTPYFTVDLDTNIFRVNSLQSGTSILAANVYSTGNIHALGNYTGNVRTDGYFFANGAPLVIPPLVTTGNTAPTAEQGATEGALWWNNEDGRSYIKYSNIWVEFSPTVLPPISRYVGNVVFYHHNISNVGNITPHTTLTYNIGEPELRWKDFYVDTIDATGNVDVGGNLNVTGDAIIGGNVMIVTDIAVNGSASISSDLHTIGNLVVDTNTNIIGNLTVNTNLGVIADVDVIGNTTVHSDIVVRGNLNATLGSINVAEDVNVDGNLHVVTNTTVDGNLQVNGNILCYSNVVPLSSDVYSIGTTGLRWKDLYVGTIDTTGNVSIGGNLFVYGNTTQVSTTSLIIDDSIIYMANNNPGNSIDIGIAGNFDNGTYQHTGFVRDASDNTWKLFSNVVAEPTNTVDFTFAVYDDILVGNISSPTITDLYANIITANSAVVNYVNDQDLNLRSRIDAANAAIITANSAVVSYLDSRDSELRANITAANAAIITANSGVISYVNTLNSAMLANVAAANAAIVTANTDMKNYVDSRTTMANATFTGTTTFSNSGNVLINGNATIGYNAIVVGNLQVQGTTTTINATSLTLTDKFITLSNGAPNAAAANGSGLYVYGASANILYQSVTDSWTFNRQPYFNSNVIYHAGNSNTLLKVNNPDQDTGDIDFGDGNPIVNGYQLQGTWLFGADGNVHAGAMQARMFNANGHVNSSGGYYVGTLDPYAGAAGNSTKIIGGDGVIYPTGGSGTAGIVFPDNIGGGSGDGASIKSYVSSGERTVLELKTTNDQDDDIILNASGAVQITRDLRIGGGVSEAFTAKSGATGVVTHDCSAGTIFYHTSPSSTFTVNATNLRCESGYTTTVTIIVSQGASAYIPNAFQIAGVAQTINWQGGSAPSGNANKKDIVSFSILNNSGTYIVFGQLVSFG